MTAPNMELYQILVSAFALSFVTLGVFPLPRNLPVDLPTPFSYDVVNHQQPNANGVLPNSVPPGGVCSVDQDCSGYPLAYCSGTCMCKDGALNAGSTCVDRGSPTVGNCPSSQIYVSEAGTCMTVAKPGDPCQYSQQCSGQEVGAFCIAQRCRCVYGMTVTPTGGCTFVNPECTQRGTIWIQELGQCKQVIAPGARTCTHHQQCTESYQNSVCFLQQCSCPQNTPVAVDGTCGTTCPSGQTFSGVLARCVATVQPGSRCQYSSQCHALHPGMVCDRGLCRCPNGQVWTGSICATNCPLGYITDPRNGLCKQGCQANQVEYQGNCLSQIVPGGACQINAQCQGGSACVNGLCECPTGTNYQLGSCQQIQSPPGGVCGYGEICIGGSFCQGTAPTAVCTCPANMVISNQVCITPATAPPGYPCPDETVVCGGGSNCRDEMCVCPSGLIIKDNECSRPVTAYPGESCADQEICTDDSFCTEDRLICQCRNEEQIIRDRLCIERPQAPPGFPCNDGEICIGGSVCERGRCACPGELIIRNGFCVERTRVPPRFSCANEEICTGGSNCIDGICECPGEQVEQNQQCIERSKVLPGFPCTDHLDICMGGSFCDEEGICSCYSDQVIRNNECLAPLRVRPGEGCGYDEICTGGSMCNGTMCVCQFDFVIMDEICVERPRVPPGYPCSNGEECTGFSICEQGLCACTGNLIIRSHECVERPRVPPGSACGDGEICTGYSLCIDEVCTCDSGSVIRNEECTMPELVAPGRSCTNGEMCSGGSFCTLGVCTCPQGLIIIADECINPPAVPPGASCANGEICSGGSYCQNFVCSCPPSMVPRGDVCILPPNVPPGSSCVGGEICTGGSVCQGGLCLCTNGLVIRNNICTTRLVVPPGVSCANGEECGGGSSCIGTICACPPGRQAIVNDQCVAPALGLITSKAQPCPLPEDPGACQLPDCFCSQSGTEIPAGFQLAETPQMVILTFDDAVNGRTIDFYRSLFNDKFRNPNGCAVKATFFVSHEWNNYDESQWLYYQGHEIGVNSITHETLSNEPVARWAAEMSGARSLLSQLSAVSRDQMIGVRAPQLAIGGENQFEMMKKQSFLYDNSMSANPGKLGPPYWPQTLDYSIPWKCEIEPCPERSFPGVWEIPINQFYGYYLPEIQQHKRGAMVRAAMAVDENSETVKNLLRENFNRAYETNRAPFVLTLGADFLNVLENNGSVIALEQFLREVMVLPGVWVVTARQALDWIRTPTPLSRINNFAGWQCPNTFRHEAAPCQYAKRCHYETQLPSGEHYFKTCATCPNSYPWLNNPQEAK